MRRLKSGHIALLAGLGWLAACGPSRALWEPTPELLARQAPDSFVVEVETSEGAFHITMHRAWSPLGVDRVYQLMSNDFYSGARFYRVLPGFVAQWGFSGTPALDSVWQEHTLADEPTVGKSGSVAR
jgi:peptidyl-prolyl cis-trans isomerase A (cyclophilin A)